MSLTDKELVQLAQGGCSESWNELYRRHQGKIKNMLRRIVRNETDTEDLALLTFEKAWRKIGQFKGETAVFTTWLGRIARNSAFDFLREKGRSPESSLEELLEHTEHQKVQHLLTHEDRADKRLEHKELRRAFRSLPEGDQALLYLVDIEGWTFQEVADAKGLALGTVKSRLFYSRRVLRKLLDPSETHTRLDDLLGRRSKP